MEEMDEMGCVQGWRAFVYGAEYEPAGGPLGNANEHNVPCVHLNKGGCHNDPS